MRIGIEPIKARFNSKKPSVWLHLVVNQDDLGSTMNLYWQLVSEDEEVQDNGGIPITGQDYKDLDRSVEGIIAYANTQLKLTFLKNIEEGQAEEA